MDQERDHLSLPIELVKSEVVNPKSAKKKAANPSASNDEY